MDTKEFMFEMFGNKPGSEYVVVWTMPDKKTRRFKDLQRQVDYIIEQDKRGKQVYFGCGFQHENLGTDRRGKKEDISGVPGFYVDVDVANIVHKKGNLPTSITDAVNLVKGHGFDPSIIVNSGHGIHAWWLFKEPWLFKNSDDRKEWELLSKRIQATVKARAEEKGWTIDSTFDETRVLRPPGCMNLKDPDNPVKTGVFEKTFARYSDPSEFDEFLIDPSDVVIADKINPEDQDAIAGVLLIDTLVEPDEGLMEMMFDADPKFKATWNQERDDLKDQTPSGYAMSLASFCAHSMWPEQEIANLIIAWNRRHGHDMKKAMRKDFLAVTILNAQRAIDKEALDDFEENVAPALGTPFQGIVDPNGEKCKKTVSTRLKMQVIELKKFCREVNPWYVMKTDKVTVNNPEGIVHFKSSNQLGQRRDFENAVFSATNFMPNTPAKKAEWNHIVNLFQHFMIEVKVSDESTIEGRTKAWLVNYLENRVPNTTVDDTCNSKEPFVFKGNWYIYKEAYRRWCWTNRGQTEGIEKTELDLKMVGCVEKRFNPKIPNSNPVKRTTRHPWKVPSAINPVSPMLADDEATPPEDAIQVNPTEHSDTFH